MNNFWDSFFQNNNSNTINSNLTKASIKRMARKAGIIYITKDVYEPVNKYFDLKRDETLNKLSKIAHHRGGKVIQSKDLNLLHSINKYTQLQYINNSKIQNGGQYDGWCDAAPSQCSDQSIQCGGSNYSDSISGQSFNDFSSNYINTEFLFPHETFKRNIKNNRKSELKVSKNLLHNLHTYMENDITNKLLNAKNKSQKNGVVSIGEILSSLI